MDRKLVFISTILIVLILLMAMTPAVALANNYIGVGPWGWLYDPGNPKCDGNHPPTLFEPCRQGWE